jgi:ketosteroid isomerase-like protein
VTEALEARLRLLEDERAILQTLYAYGHALDYGLEEEFVGCWTEDALLTYPAAVANSVIDTGMPSDRSFTGHAELRAFFRQHTHAPDAFHKHVLVEPRVIVDGDRATSTSYFERLDRRPEGPYISAFGRYVDVLVRSPDGRWRFAERRGEIESAVPAGERSVR